MSTLMSLFYYGFGLLILYLVIRIAAKYEFQDVYKTKTCSPPEISLLLNLKVVLKTDFIYFSPKYT